MPEELNPGPVEGRYRGWIVAFPFIVVAVIAGYFWADWQSRPSRPVEVTWDAAVNRTVRTERELTVYYPDPSDQWHAEMRTIRGFDTERQEMQKCMDVFFEGPVRGPAVLPGLGRVTVAGVYLDGRGMMILDLSGETEGPLNLGGVQAEYALLQAIERTVRANYPEIASIRLLVNGDSRDTLAGHIDIRRPLPVL
ncbi:MAG TPA: GerMN domain-containing protein [bacterium]|nr:GerMN domain-containing protein [bacterium]